MADSAAGSVAGQKRGVAVEQPGGLLATLIGDTSVTQRWLVRIETEHARTPVRALLNSLSNSRKQVLA